MAKNKKSKTKGKKPVRAVAGKMIKSKKKPSERKKTIKAKKLVRSTIFKKAEPSNLLKKESKMNKKEQKQEVKTVLPNEMVNAPATNSPAENISKQPSAKAIARVKAAIAAQEKAKIPPLPIDKAAAEIQLKLPEPDNKLELEYIIHASPSLLYEFITTPSGLSEWFADNVNIQGNMYCFFWQGSEQKARILSARENKFIRFQWIDRSPASYFELRIEKNELTDELSLFITDFADSHDEKNTLEALWHEQVQRLMKVIGSKI